MGLLIKCIISNIYDHVECQNVEYCCTCRTYYLQNMSTILRSRDSVIVHRIGHDALSFRWAKKWLYLQNRDGKSRWFCSGDQARQFNAESFCADGIRLPYADIVLSNHCLQPETQCKRFRTLSGKPLSGPTVMVVANYARLNFGLQNFVIIFRWSMRQ